MFAAQCYHKMLVSIGESFQVFQDKSYSNRVFKIIGFACSAYHALKAKYGSGKFWNASESDDMTSTQMRMNWSIVAEILAAEIWQTHMTRRTFSIPKFMSFYIQWQTSCQLIDCQCACAEKLDMSQT